MYVLAAEFLNSKITDPSKTVGKIKTVSLRKLSKIKLLSSAGHGY